MLRLTCVLVASAILAGCSGGGGEGFDGSVVVRDDVFDPTHVEVAAGTTVLFDVAIEAERAHTVTIARTGGGPVLLDGPVQAGDQTQYSFPEAGTYDVWCRFHGAPGSGMAMTVEAQ